MLNKNKILIIILEIIFLFSLLILMPTVFIREKNGACQTSSENILPLDKHHIYIQEFTTDYNNLNSVSVLLKNPALKSQDQVTIELLDQNQISIQSLNISGQGIEDPGWVKLKFNPLNSNKDDTFYIKITSNAQNDNDLYIYGNNQTQEINFKTTYKSANLKQSLQETINFQKEKLANLNKIYLISYIAIIIFLNVALFAKKDPECLKN